MACPMLPLLLVDSVPVLTSPGWIRPWWLLINPLMLYMWETRRIPTSFPYSPVKIEWHSWTMVFSITTLQLAYPMCVTLLEWIRSDTFPPWTEVKSLCPELRFLWHHKNNLSADANGVLWRKRSSAVSQLQLLVPKPEENDYSWLITPP